MKNFDLNAYGVVGMNNSDMENVDGGNPAVIVAAVVVAVIFVAGIYSGYKEAEANSSK